MGPRHETREPTSHRRNGGVNDADASKTRGTKRLDGEPPSGRVETIRKAYRDGRPNTRSCDGVAAGGPSNDHRFPVAASLRRGKGVPGEEDAGTVGAVFLGRPRRLAGACKGWPPNEVKTVCVARMAVGDASSDSDTTAYP